MKKRPVRFYFILSVVLAAAFFGLGFVLSQGYAPPNPGHNVRSVDGANGWYFFVNGLATVPLAPSWQSESSTSESVIGIDWNGAIVETACDPIPGYDSLAGSMWAYGGSQYASTPSSSNAARLNHRIFSITAGQIYEVYIAGKTDANGLLSAAQVLRMRLPTVSATELEFQRLWASNIGADILENEATQFECMIRVLSKCNGQVACI